MNRPDRKQYFMSIAKVVSTRATCNRQHVGAVLVRNDRILATGYNGSPRRLDHCDDVGHDIVDGRCIRSLHAEENVILQCASEGIATAGAALYCLVHPCVRCAMRLFQAGVRQVYYVEQYKSMTDTDKERIDTLIKEGMFIERVILPNEVHHE